MKKLLSIVLAVTMLSLATGLNAFAAVPDSYTTYTTSKECPVWSGNDSSTKKLRTLKKGSYISITTIVTNRHGNKFGKTMNGTYVFMGNLKDFDPGWGTDANIATIKNDVPLRYKPAEEEKIQTRIKKKGTVVDLIKVYYNDRANLWGTINYNNKEYEVYMGNIG